MEFNILELKELVKWCSKSFDEANSTYKYYTARHRNRPNVETEMELDKTIEILDDARERYSDITKVLHFAMRHVSDVRIKEFKK